VSVPRLQILLPRQTPSDVQELAEDRTIEIGTYLSDRFIALPLPPYEGDEVEGPAEDLLVVRIDIELGDEVWVERGPLLEVKLVGGVQLELEWELTVSGQVRLARATSRCRVESSKSRAANHVRRGARAEQPDRGRHRRVYRAGGDTRVYAEIVGPVETAS
jgi:hypothetical protein